MEKTTVVIVLVIILVLGSFAGALVFISTNKEDEDNKEDNNNSNNNNVYGEAFVFSLLDGGKKNTSEYYGQIVLLDFMGATCPPCQELMYVLKQISVDYEGQIEIVSIDVWIVLGETPDLLQQFVDLYKDAGVDLDWTFGYDDPSGTLFDKYIGEQGVPIVHILDKYGNIYYTKKGYLDGYSDYYELAEKIDELIE